MGNLTIQKEAVPQNLAENKTAPRENSTLAPNVEEENPSTEANPSVFSFSSVTWSMSEAIAKGLSFYPPVLSLFEEQKSQRVQEAVYKTGSGQSNDQHYLAAAHKAESEGDLLLAHWIYDQGIKDYEALSGQASFKEAWESLASLHAAKGQLYLKQGSYQKAQAQAMLGLNYLDICELNPTENQKQTALKTQLEQLKQQSQERLALQVLDPSSSAPIDLKTAESFCHSAKWTSALSVGLHFGIEALPSLNPWAIGGAFLGGGISGYLVGDSACDMATEYAQNLSWVESSQNSQKMQALASGVEFSINGIFVYLSLKIPAARVSNSFLQAAFGVTIEGLFLSAGDVLAESTAESIQDQLEGKESSPVIWERFYQKLIQKLPKGSAYSIT
ncbi:MAG: hypothetical protein KDK66_06630, partial [Deltaproteobacteria bacterium]|nr:hypothetical protein [Deltaproteobacteria bacterium]